VSQVRILPGPRNVSAAVAHPRGESAHKERCPPTEKVTDGLFEGEEAVLHVMGGLGGAPASSQTRTRVRRASRESFPKPNTPRGSAGVRTAQAYANNPIETDH
jgi:hypothetical protein